MAAKKTATKKTATPKAATKKAPAPELPIVAFASRKAFWTWLSKNHATRGVWIRLAKKGSGVASISYAEAVDVALAWGWIDGQSKGESETTYLQRFTPRAARSPWSKINREKALAMIAAGEMQAPGLAEVERAKDDGRWDVAYDPPSRAKVPDDLAAALAAIPRAASFFAKLDAQNRYAVLHRIQTAVKPETRAARIARFVEMLAKGEKLHP